MTEHWALGNTTAFMAVCNILRSCDHVLQQFCHKLPGFWQNLTLSENYWFCLTTAGFALMTATLQPSQVLNNNCKKTVLNQVGRLSNSFYKTVTT